VSLNADFANIEQGVSFNFNGLYIPREAASVPLYDIARARSAARAARHAARPQRDRWHRQRLVQRPTQDNETKLILEGGNYSLAHATAIQNLALSSDLAIRAAVDYTYRNGVMNPARIPERFRRVSACSTSPARTSVYLWGLHRPEERAHAQSGQQGLRSGHGRLQREHVPDVEPWNDKREGSLAALAPFGQPVAPDQTFHNWAGGARVDLELGNNLTLSYIPGYLYLKSDIRNYWLGALPARQSARIPEVTQELRLSGSSSNLKWLAGLYAYRTVNSGSAVFLYGFPSAFFISNVQRNRLQGAAVFGQATYSFSDALRLTVGGRYGVDDRQGTATSPAGPGLSIPLLEEIPPVRLQDRRGIRCGATPWPMSRTRRGISRAPTTSSSPPRSAMRRCGPPR
jgi:iron complex outermembrane receptor protein